jgi:hypothetical protein
MTERKVNVFFYGLFMDMGVLQQRGLAPSTPQVAYLDGYDIEIRDRATWCIVSPGVRLIRRQPTGFGGERMPLKAGAKQAMGAQCFDSVTCLYYGGVQLPVPGNCLSETLLWSQGRLGLVQPCANRSRMFARLPERWATSVHRRSVRMGWSPAGCNTPPVRHCRHATPDNESCGSA